MYFVGLTQSLYSFNLNDNAVSHNHICPIITNDNVVIVNLNGNFGFYRKLIFLQLYV